MDEPQGNDCRWPEAFPFTTETPMKQNLEADRLFDPVTKPAPNLSDYEKEEIAKRAVFERLKAERLARQASIKTK
jgi:hypothetical protein